MADALGSTLASVVAKPKTSALDEWDRQKLLREQAAAAAPAGFGSQYDPAVSRLASTAAGNASPALLAAQQASREAQARQAGNLRATTVQNVAASGQLGQGAGARAGLATEATIGQSLADSRLKERQAIGQEAADANAQLISGAQADRSFGLQQSAQQANNLNTLLDKGSAAQKIQAQTGIQALAGVTPGANTDAVNEAAYQEAISDPKYMMDQSTARTGLAQAQQLEKTTTQAIAYEPFKQQATQKGNEVKPMETSVRHGYDPGNTQIGDYVMVNGKPLQYIARNVIDSRGGGSQQAYKELHSYIFKDPVTGENIVLNEKWA